MRFDDEMRGSEGDRCTVVDLRTGLTHKGRVVMWDDRRKLATVKYDDGRLFQVGSSFVQLQEDETP